MSFLRIRHPGQPPRDIELDPGRGRCAGYGTTLAVHPITLISPAPRYSVPRVVTQTWPRCGAVMRSGALCGRRAGHADVHRTPEAVARDTARRRAAL